MRILMLGWEFPPYIAGGLGVACHGLTRALDRAGHPVTFVLPKPIGPPGTDHVRLISPSPTDGAIATLPPPVAALEPPGPAPGDPSLIDPLPSRPHHESPFRAAPGFRYTRFAGVEASFSSPYPGGGPVGHSVMRWTEVAEPEMATEAPAGPARESHATGPGASQTSPAASTIGLPAAVPAIYGSDLVHDVERFARLVVGLVRDEAFDLVHAHDWMTFPAGLAVARATGRPLVVQVHSTEFDRSGDHVDQRVYDIERAGMAGADRVIAVSNLTRSICIARYGIAPDRVDVVYNGIDAEKCQPPPGARIEHGDRVVLFLGRLTMQKGPEYFIAAARRVLEKVPNVKFIVAGTGDMAARVIEQAASAGIGSRVFFTGFLRGKDLERVFRMADCYVMPSVSEPFGLSALEAIRQDVPAIVSKTSGVSEVLRHVLKVDFWDVDELANKIVAVLRHPPLAQSLRADSAIELRRLTWDTAAQACLDTYAKVLRSRRPETIQV